MFNIFKFKRWGGFYRIRQKIYGNGNTIYSAERNDGSRWICQGLVDDDINKLIFELDKFYKTRMDLKVVSNKIVEE